MSLTNADIARTVLAFAMLLIAAHSLGGLAQRFRQPRVAGEIVGGLLLGPTLLGVIAPHWQQSIFHDGGATELGLALIYQLGLLLLMYCAGSELRSIVTKSERSTTAIIALVGSAVPFVVGLGAIEVWGSDRFIGKAGDHTAFALLFALAMAVTSIPVISRIMRDLGILGTRFSRIVLSVAVLEDVLIYVILNITLARVAGNNKSHGFGLPSMLKFGASTTAGQIYYVVITLAFVGLGVLLGPAFVKRLAASRGNILHRGSPIGFLLVVLLLSIALATFLGVAPMFGALIAGIISSDLKPDDTEARDVIHRHAYAFFIPLYFALVGLRLDLVHHFEPLQFLLVLGFACVLKFVSCYVAARLAGEERAGAKYLAVALNARGGPGIVLASVAFDAGIINASFYTTLVMLALVTSLGAGSLLASAIERGTFSFDTKHQATSSEAPTAGTASRMRQRLDERLFRRGRLAGGKVRPSH